MGCGTNSFTVKKKEINTSENKSEKYGFITFSFIALIPHTVLSAPATYLAIEILKRSRMLAWSRLRD